MECKEVCISGGELSPAGSPSGQTDRQTAGQAAVAGARPPWQAAWASVDGPVPYQHCSVTLPVSAGGGVHQTLNIQRADCGRGKVAPWQAWGPVRGLGGPGLGAWARKWRVPVALGPHFQTPSKGSFASRKGCLRGRAESCSQTQGQQPVPRGQGARSGKERKEGRGSCSHVGMLLEEDTPPWLQGLHGEAEARAPCGLASGVRCRAPAGSEAPAAPGPHSSL